MKINSRIPISMEELNDENMNGIYKEIADLTDIETAVKIHSLFRGQTVTFPVEILSREYIVKCIKDEYNGSNTGLLATKYGYSEKWIKKILKD